MGRKHIRIVLDGLDRESQQKAEAVELEALSFIATREMRSIRHYRRRGMSRRRLIEIYGQDVVDLALCGD